MFMRFAHKAVLVAVAVAAVWGLSQWLGRWPAVGAWAVVTGGACALSGYLLSTSKLNEMTWKNRLAGYLLPWGYTIGRGQLLPIVLVSWAGWALIGAAVAIQPALMPAAGTSAAGGVTPASGAPPIWSVLLFAAWAINVAALTYLGGVFFKHHSAASSGGRSMIKLATVVLGLLAVSIGLSVAGYPKVALLIAGGPYLVIGAIFGAVAGTILLLGVMGKPIRWH